MKKIYICPTKLQRSWKTFLLTIFCSGFLSFNSFAQQITFQKTYGGTNDDRGLCVKQTTDSGFIIAGRTSSFGTAYNDVYLIKADANGDTVWTKTFGGSNYDEGYAVQQTIDGGYIIAGDTHSFGAGYWDVYLIKTDANGDTVWTKTLGSVGGFARSVQQTVDSGYVIVGWTDSPGGGPSNSDIYVIKTDANGNVLWSKIFGGSDGEWASSVQQTADWGYIIVATTYSFGGAGGNSQDIYFIKMDANGNLIWTKIFRRIGQDVGLSVQQTADGGYVIAGYTVNSSGGGVCLIKTDANGDTLWTKTYEGNGAYSVQQTTDGGYIIAGHAYGFGAGGGDIYLIKADANGDTLWTKTYGGSSYDGGFSVQQTADGGYVIAGTTYSFSAGDYDVYLIKCDSLGNSGCNEGGTNCIISSPTFQVIIPPTIVYSDTAIVNSPPTIIGSGGIVTTLCTTVGIPILQSSIFNLQFSPNPLTTRSKLTFKNPNKEKFLFTLYDITGRVTESVSTTNNEIILTKGSKQAGVYLFNLVNEKTGERWNGKIVISDK
ncbi:MAG TPA: T9SS type A sorting domain-containing protein [Bacteroidia bacterium]|nr:T9SS type A sorting domain-containing protein [Bacteroidia bacterium]